MVPEVVGTQFAIGPADTDAESVEDYEALVYTEIGDIETIPAIGPQANIIKFTPITKNSMKRVVGAVDNGEPELVCFFNNTDVGQRLLVASVAVQATHAFRLILNDEPDGGTTSTIYFFHAVVAQVTSEVGAADNVTRRQVTLGLSGDILEVVAS